MSIDTIPDKHFSGGSNVQFDPDAKRQLSELINELIAAQNLSTAHEDGDGTDHAAVAAIIDDHVRAVCSAVDIQTDESEQTGVLSGDGAYAFVPEAIILVVTVASGSIAADGTLNVGTTTGGTELASAQALTGLDDVGDTRRIPLAELQTAILADDTIYANVESVDSTATTLELDVYLVGRQVAIS
jgi:hypothetical protein